MQYITNIKQRWESFKDNELQILLDSLRRNPMPEYKGDAKLKMASEIIAEISKREMAKH